MNKQLSIIAGCATLSMAAPSLAEGSDALQGQSLSQAASDPTASLMNFQLGWWSATDVYGIPEESSNTLLLRSALPFSLGETNHIMRVTAPVVFDGLGSSSGLGDITVFDLMVFNQSWGRWGFGPVALFPTGGSALGLENWGLGPAFGFTAKWDHLLAGVFNQNVFSVSREDGAASANVSIIQTIVSYGLPNKWSVGVSEMNITYDWNGDQWASLPLGVKVAKLVHFGKIPVQISAQYEHDFAEIRGVSEDIFRLNFKFIFPKP